jgi:hypothetical protein
MAKINGEAQGYNFDSYSILMATQWATVRASVRIQIVATHNSSLPDRSELTVGYSDEIAPMDPTLLEKYRDRVGHSRTRADKTGRR